MKCPKCGTEFEGNICPNCNTLLPEGIENEIECNIDKTEEITIQPDTDTEKSVQMRGDNDISPLQPDYTPPKKRITDSKAFKIIRIALECIGILIIIILYISLSDTVDEFNQNVDQYNKNLKNYNNLSKEYDAYKEKMKPYEEMELAQAEANKLAAEKELADKKAADEQAAAEKKAAEEQAAAEAEAKRQAEASATMEQKNALEKGKQYLRTMPFSYTGLFDQLKYEGYSDEASTYAVDNCGADWNEQAAKKAQQYLDTMSFSRSGLLDQLLYEGFTSEQAEYGLTSVGY